MWHRHDTTLHDITQHDIIWHVSFVSSSFFLFFLSFVYIFFCHWCIWMNLGGKLEVNRFLPSIHPTILPSILALHAGCIKWWEAPYTKVTIIVVLIIMIVALHFSSFPGKVLRLFLFLFPVFFSPSPFFFWRRAEDICKEGQAKTEVMAQHCKNYWCISFCTQFHGERWTNGADCHRFERLSYHQLELLLMIPLLFFISPFSSFSLLHFPAFHWLLLFAKKTACLMVVIIGDKERGSK